MPQVLTTEMSSQSIEQICAALAEQHGPVHAAIVALGHAAGAKAERERIQAVRAQAMPGHEKLIDTLAFDGKTTGPEAAVAVLDAERAMVEARKKKLIEETPPALPNDASATGEQPSKHKPKADAQDEARVLADKIAKVQADAQAAGRPVSVVQAMAIVKQQAA